MQRASRMERATMTLRLLVFLAHFPDFSTSFEEKLQQQSLKDAATDPSWQLRHDKVVSDLRQEVNRLKAQLDACQRGDVHPRAKAPEGRTIPAGSLTMQAQPYFCTPEVSDFEKWRERRLEMRKKKLHDGWDSRKGTWNNITVTPHWYCDKLTNNLDPWVKPGLTPNDVVVGLFTGESLFYGRASASRDTWLLRFPHHYIFAATSDPRIPAVGLTEMSKYKGKYDKHGFVAGNERMNAQHAQLLGTVVVTHYTTSLLRLRY